MKKYGQIEPTPSHAMTGNLGGGNHEISPLPGPGGFVGGGGAATSIVVVIICPNEGAVTFHFGTDNGNAGATIGQYAWYPDCHAAICGGNTGVKVSNCLMNDIVDSLNSNGVKIDGIIDRSGCTFGSDGKWHFGSGDAPSKTDPNQR
jgi:hypothetical protein